MLFSTATVISLLGLTSFSVTAHAIPAKRTIDTGFWQLVTKPPGDPTAIAIPIVLGWQPDNGATRLGTDATTDVPLCIELTPNTDAQGMTFKAAKVITHPTITEDLWLWKSIGQKQLATSTRINIAGIRGDWAFVSVPGSADMVLALDGDTVAGVSDAGNIMHFGADTPVSAGAVPLTVVGIPVDSCEM